MRRRGLLSINHHSVANGVIRSNQRSGGARARVTARARVCARAFTSTLLPFENIYISNKNNNNNNKRTYCLSTARARACWPDAQRTCGSLFFTLARARAHAYTHATHRQSAPAGGCRINTDYKNRVQVRGGARARKQHARAQHHHAPFPSLA